jgi:hypothetical protein
VAELVRDDALQLVAVEPLERAVRDRDRGVGGREPGGERVDALLAGQHVHLGHRRAGRDRHLLDDVPQPAQPGVGGVLGHVHATERLRDLAATAALERQRPEERGQPDRDDQEQAEPDHRVQDRGRGLLGEPEQEERDQVDDRDERDHGEDEQQDQAARRLADVLLTLEEVHRTTALTWDTRRV